MPAPRLSGRNGYSLFVSSMKLLLPCLAAALIILVVAWPQIRQHESLMGRQIIESARREAQNLRMVNARYTGVDDKNQPFSITAERASQSSSESSTIALDRPQADLGADDGSWMALKAEVGQYDRRQERLDLSGGVNLFHDRGFEITTPAARIELDKGLAHGEEPVRGEGPNGTLEAEGFRLKERGKDILFTGRSRLVINGSSREAE